MALTLTFKLDDIVLTEIGIAKFKAYNNHDELELGKYYVLDVVSNRHMFCKEAHYATYEQLITQIEKSGWKYTDTNTFAPFFGKIGNPYKIRLDNDVYKVYMVADLDQKYFDIFPYLQMEAMDMTVFLNTVKHFKLRQFDTTKM